MQEFWNFVFDHLNDDPNRLRLKFHDKAPGDFDVDLAIVQIECRKRFAKKLSDTLTAHPRWLFPSVLSGEQSTSDRLAAFHASLARGATSIADLTAGLGIDAIHLSTVAQKVYAIEIDPVKADALRYNFLDSNVEILNMDCRDWVGDAPACDCMFIDPARRAADGSRVYALSQCQPDVTEMLSALQKVTKRLIVKLSPMLDITHAFSQLPQANTIISLGTETECKELIALVDFTRAVQTRHVEAVTLKNDGTQSVVTFDPAEESLIESVTGTPSVGCWLYDPYPALMKAAPYRTLSKIYDVKVISNNTHLYFSEREIEDFPGHRIQIADILPFASKHIKRLKSQYPKINVITRNFDIPADKLRQKLGVSDGGIARLYAVTLFDGQKAMILGQ